MRNVILRVVELILEGAALLHRQGVGFPAELVPHHLEVALSRGRSAEVSKGRSKEYSFQQTFAKVHRRPLLLGGTVKLRGG